MRREKALLVFNAQSGDQASSEAQLRELLEVLNELQVDVQLYRVPPRGRITQVVATAARRGIPYVVACGGDNTIDLAARGLAGSRSTLVIVPTGTRNNIARALKVPINVTDAARLLADGQRTQLDMGQVRVVGRETFFLELSSVGLGAAVFSSMEDMQKGNLAALGDLFATFVTHPPATFRLNLDRGRQKIKVEALTLVVLNMPYLGANFQIGSGVDPCDGLLDVFIYAELGKLDLLTHALQVAQGVSDDPRVKHLRVKHLSVETDPPMPLMLDGRVLSQRVLQERMLRFGCAKGALNVMTRAK